MYAPANHRHGDRLQCGGQEPFSRAARLRSGWMVACSSLLKVAIHSNAQVAIADQPAGRGIVEHSRVYHKKVGLV